MPKYSYGYSYGALYVWEANKPDPPNVSTKILRVENNDTKVASTVVRALNNHYNYITRLNNQRGADGGTSTTQEKV